MTTKHTEWFFDKVGNNYDQWMVYNELSGKTLASVEGQANARLMAAAPELIEALKQAEISLKNSIKDGEGGIARECSLDIVQNAISKATD